MVGKTCGWLVFAIFLVFVDVLCSFGRGKRCYFLCFVFVVFLFGRGEL